MAGIFSPSSSPTSAPASFQQGFSEIGGAVQPINLNISGATKVGKHATLAPVINLTDQGALNAAMEISSQNLRGIELLSARLETSFAAAIAAVSGQGEQAIEAVSSANRGETENLGLAAIKWGALVAGGYLVVRALGVLK